MSNIAILCSGGDVSGMNPALKRFVEYALLKKLTPFFVFNGFEGLIDNRIVAVGYPDVSGIIAKGGTKIGSSRSKRFLEPSFRAQAANNLHKLNIEMLVILGGDGSFKGMQVFSQEHEIACVGIPATIDNDIEGTEYTLGVDTALNVIKNAIDALRDTASSFNRAFVVETMGRNCGYLALVSGMTSGAEMILIPEVPYDLKAYEERFTKEIHNGRNYFIAVISEGIQASAQSIADWFEERLHFESRVTILGHIQRGGNPSVYDRLMAFGFVTHAIDALLEGDKQSVVCYNAHQFERKAINDVAGKQKVLDQELLNYYNT